MDITRRLGVGQGGAESFLRLLPLMHPDGGVL